MRNHLAKGLMAEAQQACRDINSIHKAYFLVLSAIFHILLDIATSLHHLDMKS